MGTATPSSIKPVKIANGQSLSAAIDLRRSRLRRIVMPAAWTTATSLTFQASYDGVTYSDLYTSAGEYTVGSAAANREIVVNVDDFASIQFLKVRSGTSGSPVAQSADRTFQLVCT